VIGGLPDAPETFVLGSDQMSVRISWLEPPGLRWMDGWMDGSTGSEVGNEFDP